MTAALTEYGATDSALSLISVLGQYAGIAPRTVVYVVTGTDEQASAELDRIARVLAARGVTASREDTAAVLRLIIHGAGGMTATVCHWRGTAGDLSGGAR